MGKARLNAKNYNKRDPDLFLPKTLESREQLNGLSSRY